MKDRLKKLTGAVLTLAALAASPAPAHADPNWTLYNEGTGAPLTGDDTVAATGSLNLSYTKGGVLRTSNCLFTSANPLLLASSGPISGAPGSTLGMDVVPPSSLTCFEGTIPHPATISSPWSVNFTLPAAGTTTGQLYGGPLTWTMEVPLNSLAIDFSSTCAGTSVSGPTTPTASKTTKSFLWGYDAGSGVLTATANQVFTVSSTGCSILNMRISKATLTLNPVLDLQW